MLIVGRPPYRRGDQEGAHRVSDQQKSTIRTLRRLWPYVRPHRARLGVVLSATMLAMLCGLGIPLLTRRIVDGPIQHKQTDVLPWLIIGVLLLGLAEAGLFYVRRKLAARPAAEVEARMRMDLYRHL